MEVFLREWRQDALNRHQYQTAIMFADKALAMTGMCNDVRSPPPFRAPRS